MRQTERFCCGDRAVRMEGPLLASSNQRKNSMRNDNSAPGEASTSGKDAIRQLLHTSPFVDQLSIRLTDLQPGVAKLTLPFAASFATLETNVPVGAIACLIDTAAMAAAWSGAKRAEKQRG